MQEIMCLTHRNFLQISMHFSLDCKVLTISIKTYDSTNQARYRLLSVLPEGEQPEYDSREGGLTQGSLQVTGISSEGYSLSWENGDGIIYGVPLQTIHDASKTFGEKILQIIEDLVFLDLLGLYHG